MRLWALVVLAALTFGAAPAFAEKVKANQSTKLYSRAGEQSKVLLKVKSGQNMTVLAKEGRWLKVRVLGRTGYVPRSKVEMADTDEIVRNTRRRPFVDGRGTKRGFGGAEGPDDRVGADATGDSSGGGDDEAEDSGKSKGKKGGGGGDEEDEDEGGGKAKAKAKAKAKKGGGDDEEDVVVDDDKTEEAPEDDRQVAHVDGKTSIYAEPSRDSDEQFVARPSDALYPTEKKGKWTFVENAEGDGGWVLTSKLDLEDGSDGGNSGIARKRSIDAHARLGLTFIQQGMRTTGSNMKVPDNYNISTSSVTVSIGAGLLLPQGKKYLVGGELTYDYAQTVFGGVFYDPDPADATPGVNTPVTIHNINVRGLAGIDFKKKSGLALIGHLGYRYQGFIVADYADPAKNPAKLPSETVKGPTIGAALALPRLSSKIGLGFSLDAMVIGASVHQTEGLEDGSSPSAKAFCFGAGFTYRWKKSMDLQGTYDLDYMSIDFGAPSMQSTRGHTGTGSARTDFFHVVTFGVMKAF